jgi:SAM-dependent methyltransferase
MNEPPHERFSWVALFRAVGGGRQPAGVAPRDQEADGALGARMRSDWDERAKKDALFYIASGVSEDPATFWESGRRELDEQILADLQLSPAARALEIGCGVGRLVRPLAERIGSVVGVDISPEMVRRARELCAGVPNATFEVTEGSLETVSDASLDLVYSYIVFQHIPSVEPIARYVREAARALRPGGVMRFQLDGRPSDPASHRPDTYAGIRFDRAAADSLLANTDLTIAAEWGRDTHYYWITAVRPGANENVRRRERLADPAELERLAADLGGLETLGGLRRALDGFLRAHAGAEPRAVVSDTFRLLLARTPSEVELDYNAGLIEKNLETAETWIDSIVCSKELRDRLTPLMPAIAPGALETLTERISREIGPVSGASASDACGVLVNYLRRQPTERAVPIAYRALLGREADADGLRFYERKLERRELGVATFVLELLGSAEFQEPRSE